MKKSVLAVLAIGLALSAFAQTDTTATGFVAVRLAAVATLVVTLLLAATNSVVALLTIRPPAANNMVVKRMVVFISSKGLLISYPDNGRKRQNIFLVKKFFLRWQRKSIPFSQEELIIGRRLSNEGEIPSRDAVARSEFAQM